MQYRDRTIELIVPADLATVIDEYAIFGPKLSDGFPSFFGVSLSEHLVEIAFDEDLYGIGHNYSRVSRHEEARGKRRAVPRRIRRAAQRPRNVHRGRLRSNRRVANRPARPTIAAVGTLRPGKCSRRQADRAAASRNRSRNSHSRGARRTRPCW